MRSESLRPPGLKRRRGPRIPVHELEGAVSVVGAKLLNVSLHGMLIESPVPLERESVLRLRLVIAGRRSDVEARVAECTRGGAGEKQRYGVGLEFIDIPAEARRSLERALAQLPARLRSAPALIAAAGTGR